METILAGTEVQDIDAWCEEALTEAFIAETEHDIKLSFAASLGELVLLRQGIDIRPPEER